MLNRQCLVSPYPPLARHLDLRILKHLLFLVFCNYSCKNVNGAAARHYDS